MTKVHAVELGCLVIGAEHRVAVAHVVLHVVAIGGTGFAASISAVLVGILLVVLVALGASFSAFGQTGQLGIVFKHHFLSFLHCAFLLALEFLHGDGGREWS